MTSISRGLSLSDKALEQISQVSPLDIEAARALWASRVSGRFRTLLDSQTVTPGARLSSPFVWDASSRRYISLQSRRYVPFTEIRGRAIEALIRGSRASLVSLGTALQETGDLATWERGAIEEIKTTQVAAALAANGGASSQSEDDRNKTAEILLLLLLLLRGFARDIFRKKTPLNGLLFLRSGLYAQTARGTFEEMRRFGMGAYFGAVEERRKLGIADHCTSDDEREGCVELADRGWSPIGTLPRLGDTPCRSNCYCRFIYRYRDERGEWVEVDDSKTVARILSDLKIKESVDG